MNPSLRKYIGLGLVLLVIVAGGFWLVQNDTKGLPEGYQLHYPSDIQFVYAIESRFASLTPLPSAGDKIAQVRKEVVSGEIGVVGNLTMQGRGHALGTGHRWVEFGLTDVSKIDFSLYGTQIPVSRDQIVLIEAAKAYGLLNKVGELQELRFPEGTSVSIQQLFRPLVLESLVTLKTGVKDWSTERERYAGTADEVSRVVGIQPELFELAREARSYSPLKVGAGATPDAEAKLTGGTSFTLHKDGYVVALNVDHGVEVLLAQGSASAQVKHRLQLLERQKVAPDVLSPEAFAKMQRLDPSELPGEDLARKQALDQRIAGLTIEKVTLDLKTYGAAGRMPNHQDWFFRTSGLLERNPELVYEFTSLFFDPAMAPQAKNVLMDLLAGAGTEMAQSVMEEILTDGRTQASPHFSRWVQSATLLVKPTASMMTTLGDLAGQGENLVNRSAASVTYGAGIAKLAMYGEEEEAERHNSQLQGMLKETTSNTVRRGLLYGLGNSRMESNFPIIQEHLVSGDSRNREIATRALRHLKSDEAQRALRGMLQDAAPKVQESALRAMVSRGLDDEDLGAIEQRLKGGDVDPEIIPNVIRSLGSLVGTDQDISTILSALRQVVGNNIELRRQVNELATQLAANRPG